MALRPNTPRVALIGFGEAGQAIAGGLRDEGVERVAAWDILFPDERGTRLKDAATRLGVRPATSSQDAVREADIVIAAVTAASSVTAAETALPHLSSNAFYLDINSVSPGRKQETAKLLEGKARYVDVAVMSPIHPARHKSPMHIAGAHSEALAPVLQSLGMNITMAGPNVGAAAAIKMIRGVIIKGIEALTEECFIAAQRAGVPDDVMASMTNNYPTLDWDKIISYNLERMASHGERRAAEMEEVADTLRELGVEPLMVEATVKRQRAMGALGKRDDVKTAVHGDRAAMLKTVSEAAKTSR